MAIKIIHREPKATDFNISDLILDAKNGHLYYKSSNNDLFKIQGDNVKTNITEFTNVDDIIIEGNLIPNTSGSQDLGSAEKPWRYLHVLDESIKFYKKGGGEIGKIQFEQGKGLKIRDNTGAETALSASVVVAPQARFVGITGSLNGGSFN